MRESAPTSGSFVREAKIRRGTSLMDGVRSRFAAGFFCEKTLEKTERYLWHICNLSRYGQDFEDTIDVQGLREVQKSMNAPLLELVGFDKLSKRQREFHKLRVISVRGHLVDR